MVGLVSGVGVLAAGFTNVAIAEDEGTMQNNQVGIGVIGYGYWGPNLVRNFASLTSACVVGVSDLDSAKLAAVKRSYPGVVATENYEDLLNDKRIDAVAIATPVQTHYEIARLALRAGKHVFVEKPL